MFLEYTMREVPQLFRTLNTFFPFLNTQFHYKLGEGRLILSWRCQLQCIHVNCKTSQSEIGSRIKFSKVFIFSLCPERMNESNTSSHSCLHNHPHTINAPATTTSSDILVVTDLINVCWWLWTKYVLYCIVLCWLISVSRLSYNIYAYLSTLNISDISGTNF